MRGALLPAVADYYYYYYYCCCYYYYYDCLFMLHSIHYMVYTIIMLENVSLSGPPSGSGGWAA